VTHREQTVKLVLDDLHKERAAMDDLRKQVAADLKTLGDKLAAVGTEREKPAQDQAKSLADGQQTKHEMTLTVPATAPPAPPTPVVRTVFDYDSRLCLCVLFVFVVAPLSPLHAPRSERQAI
jgi:hypothetical protein